MRLGIPDSPGGVYTQVSEDAFADWLRKANTFTRQARQWGGVERLDGMLVMRFLPPQAGYACAGVYRTGPAAGLGGYA